MLLIDMSQRLQQDLLTHFLQSRGFSFQQSTDVPVSENQPTTLLTDKLPPMGSVISFPLQIWLLDKHRPMPVHIPTQVKGILLSDCELNELEICIKQVLLYQSYLSPSLLTLLSLQTRSFAMDESTALTSREREVLDLIKRGRSLRVIADTLFISVHTAENHRANIQKKLGLTGRLSLIRYAATTM